MGTSKYYRWTVKVRCNFMLSQLGQEFFKGKSLLEVGSNHGDFGNWFHQMGASVTCLDARDKNLNIVKANFPHLNRMKFDLNKGFPDDQWDIITHMRVLHHLLEPEKAIREMVPHGNFFILEARVLDSDDPYLLVDAGLDRKDYDQHGPSKRWASAAYYERVLKDCGLSVRRHDDPALNSGRRKYDWKVKETGEFHPFKSRFWMAWK